MMNIKNCEHCGAVFFVPDARVKTARFCSRKCSDSAPRKKNKTFCSECGSLFFIKKSQEIRNKYWGSFCSKECNSAFRKRMSIGESNPNFKGRNYDSDGYRKYVPHGKGVTKLHHHVAFQNLGINNLPTGSHIHHKDCDIMNNSPENLQLMSIPDHRWVHREFGASLLWALQSGKIDIDRVVSWSSDQAKAYYLLASNVIIQGAILKNLKIKDENQAFRMLTTKPLVDVEFIEADALSDTERGVGGFGSTGA